MGVFNRMQQIRQNDQVCVLEKSGGIELKTFRFFDQINKRSKKWKRNRMFNNLFVAKAIFIRNGYFAKSNRI